MNGDLAIVYVDSRDGMLTAHIAGNRMTFTSAYAMALTLHTFGIRFVVEPPDEEGWPDYADTDGWLYTTINEELQCIRDSTQERIVSNKALGERIDRELSGDELEVALKDLKGYVPSYLAKAALKLHPAGLLALATEAKRRGSRAYP